MSSQQQPKPDDAVLGGQSGPAMDALVLGGIEGLQQRFELGNDDRKRQALKELKQYGDRGLTFLLELLQADIADSIKQSAIKHLQDFDLKNKRLEKTIAKVLTQLASDKDWSVRSRAAKNSNCPVELLEKLASDQNGWVRSGAATNPNCPSGLLEKLASDEDKGVRFSARLRL
jgi:hypothetical protein